MINPLKMRKILRRDHIEDFEAEAADYISDWIAFLEHLPSNAL